MGATTSIGKMAVAGFGLKTLGMVSPLFEYKRRRNEGQSVLEAGVKSVAEEAMFAIAPGPMMAAYLVPAIAGGIGKAGAAGGKKQAAQFKNNFGGNLTDTDQAYTMRQRGLQAIQKTGMNTRSVLGTEARRARY